MSTALTYRAPRVTSLTGVHCTVDGAFFAHGYTVVLDGGSDWYFQDQVAPHAVVKSFLENQLRTYAVNGIHLGIGPSKAHATGRFAFVPFPHSALSTCA